jgi:hypothetical protein
MNNLLCIGQWQGFYSYGPEYGEYIEGKETEFRLFIEEITKDEFSGRVIDWDGFGADGQISEVKGFISGQVISFIKKYPNCQLMDELYVVKESGRFSCRGFCCLNVRFFLLKIVVFVFLGTVV